MGNDDVFRAKDVKVFDRVNHHYGHPYTDFNAESPVTPIS